MEHAADFDVHRENLAWHCRNSGLEAQTRHLINEVDQLNMISMRLADSTEHKLRDQWTMITQGGFARSGNRGRSRYAVSAVIRAAHPKTSKFPDGCTQH